MQSYFLDLFIILKSFQGSIGRKPPPIFSSGDFQSFKSSVYDFSQGKSSKNISKNTGTSLNINTSHHYSEEFLVHTRKQTGIP